MGTITVHIPDSILEAFRDKIGRTKGFKKGNLSQAVTEAVELWLKK